MVVCAKVRTTAAWAIEVMPRLTVATATAAMRVSAVRAERGMLGPIGLMSNYYDIN